MIIKLPSITTVIPTYKRPILLKRAITSVLSQTFNDFNICIYDNSSGDETYDVVSEFMKDDSRIHYYCHPTNIGAFNNFIFSMKRIKTRYFCFLSDDDLILPSFYEEGMKALNKFPGAALFAGATIRLSKDGNILSIPMSKWKEGVYSAPDGFYEMLVKGHPEWTGIIFDNKVLNDIGSLDKETGFASDLDYELRIAANKDIIVSRKPCAVFFMTPNSPTSIGGLHFTWPGWLKMIDNVKGFSDVPTAKLHWAVDFLARKMLNRIYTAGIKAFINGDWEETEKVKKALSEVKGGLRKKLLMIILTQGVLSPIYRLILRGLRGVRRLYRWLGNKAKQNKWDEAFIASRDYVRDQYLDINKRNK